MEKLVGLGASSMQGVGDSEGGFLLRLVKMLKESGRDYQGVNRGNSGDTTRDMLARLDKVRVHLPAKGVIFLGSNDTPRDNDDEPGKRTDLKEFTENVTTLLKAFEGSPTIYVSSFAVSQKTTRIRPETFAEYSRVAMEIAASLGMTTWDLHTESRAFGDWPLDPDGLHYNDSGHKMIAEHLFAMTQKLGW